MLLAKAYELGCLDCAGYPTALKAAEQLARLHPARRAEADEKALAVYELEFHCPKANATDAARHYLDKVREMAEDRLKTSASPGAAPGSGPDAAEALNAAVGLYQRGAFAARAIGPEQQAEVLDRIKTLRQLQDVRARVESLRRQLDRLAADTTESAEDRKAAAELVRLLAIDLSDAPSAAEYAPATGDPGLPPLLALAARDPTSLDEPEAKRLGDWYRRQARASTVGRLDALAKARVCYERVLALHSDRDLAWLEAKAACGEIVSEQDRQVKERQARVNVVKADLAHDKEKAARGRTGRAATAAGAAGTAAGGGD